VLFPQDLATQYLR